MLTFLICFICFVLGFYMGRGSMCKCDPCSAECTCNLEDRS